MILKLDFDLATLNGDQNQARNFEFGSLGFHQGHESRAIDDFQSLVLTIWHIAGIQMGETTTDGSAKPEGLVLCEKRKIGEAESRVKVSLE